MSGVDIILETKVRGKRVTVDCERAHGIETWLLCLRVDGVLSNFRSSDDPPRNAQDMLKQYEKPTRIFG